jgi:hypothetical protein
MTTQYEYQVIEERPKSRMDTQQSFNNMGAAGWIYCSDLREGKAQYSVWRRPIVRLSGTVFDQGEYMR